VTEITKTTTVAEVVDACPTARGVFDKHGLKGCGGEHGPKESLAFFAPVHQVDVEALVRELNAEMRNPSRKEYVYREAARMPVPVGDRIPDLQNPSGKQVQ